MGSQGSKGFFTKNVITRPYYIADHNAHTKLQMEKEKLEMEKRVRMKEIVSKTKLEQEKLEKQGSSGASTHSGFDATKNIRLVPKFEEKEVDKYFLHFEKIAKSLKWPKES